MNPEPPPTAPPSPAPAPSSSPMPNSSQRRGVVLVAVLIVVASLSLAAYHYSDMMMSEYKASENAHRSVQARSFAASGIYYTAAMLSNPDNFNNVLNGNCWNNPTAFQDIAISGDGNMQGRFSIVAPPSLDDPDLTTCNYGVSDECGKLNPNAIMLLDPTGQKLHDMLMLLPNMTDDIAWSIVSWMGGSAGVTNSGAGNDYYQALTPPYRCKNAPIDSIDELLLIRGVTRDLLYGTDFNRNGVQDSNNEIGANGFDRGWSAYLTVHSREQNSDSYGNSFIYLNNTDLNQLYTQLTSNGISTAMANYIIMYCQFGPMSPGGGNNTLTMNGNDPGSYTLSFTTKAKANIHKTIYDMIGSSVAIPSTTTLKFGGGGGGIVMQVQVNKIYACPLNDPTVLVDQFPKLYAIATVVDPTKTPELIPRINVLTAPSAVLATLPGLTANDVANIVAARPKLSSTDPPDPIYASPVWLLTMAQISQKTLVNLDPLITSRSQVYRVQSVGYFDGKGPAIRLEAVIDTNAGRPRILAWRDLSEFGKGWNVTPLPAAAP